MTLTLAERERGLTRRLCSFIDGVTLSSIPRAVIERAKHLILDGLACGLVAARLDWSDRAVTALTSLDGLDASGATIWGRAVRVPPSTAAVLNGAFIQGFELDDYHELGPLHSEACVLPAVMATAEHLGNVTGRQLLESVIVGFEVGPRVGTALGGLDLVSRGWHSGSVFGPIASAAAVGKLRSLDQDGLEDAIGIAATQAGGLMAAQYESMVKRMHSGFAARSGVVAGALAQAGYTGIKAVIERPYGGYASAFLGEAPADLEKVLDGAGQRWEISAIAVKPYVGMGGLHTSIEGALALRDRDGLTPDKVAAIEIYVGHAMYHHAGWRLLRPATTIGAQMNLGYAVAVALIDGVVSVPQFAPPRLDASDVHDLIARTTVFQDAAIDSLGEDGKWVSRLIVTTVDGASHKMTVEHPKGGRIRPLSDEEIRRKFQALTRLVMPPERAEALQGAVLGLETCDDLSGLVDLLAGVVTAPY